MNHDISIIVPFFQRDEYAIQTFKQIDLESKKENLSIELIFVDSKSRATLQEDLKKLSVNSDIDWKIYDTRDYVSVKRNHGISQAKSENIIVIDDDCMPCENFLKYHYKSLAELKDNKSLICGVVKYKQELIDSSNYYKFRDEGHRKFDNSFISSKNLNFHNIVVMNMSFKKKAIVDNELYFNEEFNTYGFEDLQFGIDALSKNFQIITNQATIIHQDSTPLNLYHKKIQSFGKTYFFLFYPYNLKKISNGNKDEVNNLITKHFYEYKTLNYLSRLNINKKKNNILSKFVYLIIGFVFNFISKLVIIYLSMTDKFRFLYSFKAYKLFVHLTLVASFFEKKQVNKEWL